MVLIAPALPAATDRAVRTVVEAALRDGDVPEPSCLIVEDGAGRWLDALLELSEQQRVRAVLAAASDGALAAAVRLGVGGALWLPPSTPAMNAALTAAAAAPGRTRTGDPALFGLVAGDVLVAALPHGAFWRRQLGVPRLARFLGETGARVGGRSLVLDRPALLTDGATEQELRREWEAVVGGDVLAPPDSLAVTKLAAGEACGPHLWDALHALEAGAPEPLHGPTGPVFALPSGRHMGWHAPVPVEVTDGWLAVPADPATDSGPWQLLDGSGTTVGTVAEAATVAAVRTARDVAAVRMAGWATERLGRPGSPAMLLVAQLARAAKAGGVPLWVPNVEEGTVRRLLGLGVELWVDGPAVPAAPAR